MKSKKLLSIVMAAAICVPILATISFKGDFVKADSAVTTESSNIARLGGIDRYDTSVKISQFGWKQADNVFIAGAENDTDFADAIAGTPLAYDLDAPILLTRVAALPDTISSEITRLAPKNIYILGGIGVVSQAIEDGLKAKGYNVTRIAGADRYDTAIQIAQKLWEREPNSKSSVAITTGKQFQYAMSDATNAAKYHTAILFSDGDTLNSDVESLLDSNKSLAGILVIGGDKVLSLKSNLYNGAPGLFRIENYNSVDDICEGTGDLQNLNNFTGVAVASNTIFPDSLSGSVLAAKSGYRLILSDGKKLNYNIDSRENNLSGGLIFGGKDVVADDIITQIKGMLNKDIPSNVDGLKDSDPVSFSDSAFQKDAEKSLGKTNITIADAKSVTRLVLYQDSSDGGEQLSSLDDIKYFTNAISLELNGGTLPSNVNPLNSMNKLKFLDLEKNCKYDSSVISSLSKNITFAIKGKNVTR